MGKVKHTKVAAALMALVLLGSCDNTSTLPPYWGGDVETYKRTPHFRAFVIAGRGATSSSGYSWASSRESVEDAIDVALGRCQSLPTGYVCKVIYLGDIDVWGMSKEEFEHAKAVYSKNPAATNDDL